MLLLVFVLFLFDFTEVNAFLRRSLSYLKEAEKDLLLPGNTQRIPFFKEIDSESMEQTINNENFTQNALIMMMSSLTLSGDWQGELYGNQLSYLNGSAGLTYMENLNPSDSLMWNINLCVFDQDRLDQQYIQFSVQANASIFNFNSSNATLDSMNFQLPISYGYNSLKSCTTNLSLYFINSSLNDPIALTSNIDTNSLEIQFVLQSPECSLSILANLQPVDEELFAQIFIYICLMGMGTLIGYRSTKILEEKSPRSIEALTKISIWSMCFMTGWDIYLSIFHIIFSLRAYGILIVIPAFLGLLMILPELRLAYSIYLNYYKTTNTFFSEGYKLLLAYCILLGGLNFSIFHYTDLKFMQKIFAFYLFPQIYDVYQRGRDHKLNIYFVFGLLPSKLIFIIYVSLWEGNFFQTSVDWLFAFTFLGLVFLQIIILFIQKKWPKFWNTPKKFNYYINIRHNNVKEEVCPICLEPLAKASTGGFQTFINNLKRTKIMQTPCKHKFHITCLQDWLRTRQICPLDRLPVPPLS